MKASDFRVGNAYLSTDNTGIKTVTGRDLMAWDSGAIYGKPLPLTEKILSFFGFEHGNTYLDCWMRLGDIEIPVDNDKNEHDRIYVRGDLSTYRGLQVDLTYVHQLQNFSFALYGQELYLPENFIENENQ